VARQITRPEELCDPESSPAWARSTGDEGWARTSDRFRLACSTCLSSGDFGLPVRHCGRWQGDHRGAARVSPWPALGELAYLRPRTCCSLHGRPTPRWPSSPRLAARFRPPLPATQQKHWAGLTP